MFGGPARKSAEWAGFPGSGKKFKRSMGGEGDMMGHPDMSGHLAAMYAGRMSKDDMDGGYVHSCVCAASPD